MLGPVMSICVREMHPVRGRERRLDDGAVIGRAPDCDLRLEDPLVSRRHARVLGSEIGTGIEDLDSSNGLYVNGRRRPGVTPLHPGDVIQIGGTLWMVSDEARAIRESRSSSG
jgi:pSer/pThr/pTyr-binding forkhead associated (FHA) protein